MFPKAIIVVKNLPANAGDVGGKGSIPKLGGSPGEGVATNSSILAWKSHGQRSLACYSPWDRKESEATEHKQSYYMCRECLKFMLANSV